MFRTHEWAPRVLIANSNLVGKWANWDTFRELERAGLTMYGQMTAGSWIYIGTQGILQGTYETFAELARQHFGGTLRGRVVLTAGLGGMGGAQPLAVTMNDGVAIVHRGRRGAGPAAPRHRLRRPADRPLRRGARVGPRGRRRRRVRSRSRSSATPPRSSPAWATAGERFDVVTDQTSAHDALGGYVPAEISLADAPTLRGDRARRVRPARRCARWPTTSGRCSPSRPAGAVVFDYGNNIRAQAQEAGVADAFDFPGFVPAFIRPLFCEGKGPFRWAALSGDPGRHPADRRAILELFPEDAALRRWIRDGRGEGPVPGAAGADLLARLRRAREGRAWRSTSWSGPGEVSAPIVIGRDHLDAGSVASPNRETEAMRDGSDAIADWPLLNALVNTAAGATWV